MVAIPDGIPSLHGVFRDLKIQIHSLLPALLAEELRLRREGEAVQGGCHHTARVAFAHQICGDLHVPVVLAEDLRRDEGNDGRGGRHQRDVAEDADSSLRHQQINTLTKAGPQSQPKPFCALRIKAR